MRSEFWKADEEERKVTNLMYSIGVLVREDGTIADVLYGGPAQKAGIAPAVKLIAVNGRQYTPTVLREAVATQDSPVELLVKNGEFYQTFRVDYTRRRALSAPGARRERARFADPDHGGTNEVTQRAVEIGMQQPSP